MYDVVCVFVNESTECETIPPAGGHVSDLHPRVVLHLPPAPLLQGRHPHHVVSVAVVVVVVM